MSNPHLSLVASYPCMVCDAKPPSTVHHCHGPSMHERGFGRGMSQRPSDYLAIPLCYDCHQGRNGIDGTLGSKKWESLYGTQAEFIDELGRMLGMNLWEKASEERIMLRARRRHNRSHKLVPRT